MREEEPLLHILWINVDDELMHLETFKDGFIAAMRLNMATSEELEEAWRNQAEEIFKVYLNEAEKKAERER